MGKKVAGATISFMKVAGSAIARRIHAGRLRITMQGVQVSYTNLLVRVMAMAMAIAMAIAVAMMRSVVVICARILETTAVRLSTNQEGAGKQITRCGTVMTILG
jgi:hypothetical protein